MLAGLSIGLFIGLFSVCLLVLLIGSFIGLPRVCPMAGFIVPSAVAHFFVCFFADSVGLFAYLFIC